MRHFIRPIVAATTVFCLLIAASGAEPPRRIFLQAKHPSPEPTVILQYSEPGSSELLGIWIDAAKASFSRVRDYQCTFSKCERIDGVLQDEQTANLRVRQEPFSVHVKFTAPRAVAGREGSYVAGRLNGKMKAKSGGALALVGYVTLDPRDPKALHGTRHGITEAGIGNLIDRLAEAQHRGNVPARATQVSVADVEFARRDCVRFDVLQSDGDDRSRHSRSLVYLDKETNLPIRYEAYDRRGNLIERFSYIDLHFNVGLTDASFP